VLGSKTVWIPGAIRGGRRYGTPKLKIPVFPHYINTKLGTHYTLRQNLGLR